MSNDILLTGCVYGQYSSLDEFSYDAIRYVGMTGTSKWNCDAQTIANKRLAAQLNESAKKSGNPTRFAWYRSVENAGGQVLDHVLAEVHNVTRRELGDLEYDWIAKLGGPVIGGEVVQLFNLTHGRDGGWSTYRSAEWLEAASQRMIDRYATEESRREHGNKIRQRYADNPEARELLSELQKEIQNRPERLAQNRQHGLEIWTRPEYRAKQEIEKPCEFCGQICHSYRGYGTHVLHCPDNPDRAQRVDCPMGCGLQIIESSLTQHFKWCTENPDATGEAYGPRSKVICPHCGKECGAGAGLRAHVKWNHDRSNVGVSEVGVTDCE